MIDLLEFIKTHKNIYDLMGFFNSIGELLKFVSYLSNEGFIALKD